MQIPILTKSLPLQIVLSLNIKMPGSLFVRAYDPDKQNTVYLSREWPCNAGNITMPLNLPLSPPEGIVVTIKSSDGKPDNQVVQLQGISTKPLLRKTLFLPAKDIAFVKFAEWFCQNCGYMAADTYEDTEKQFTIKYMDRIVDDVEGEIDTPARVDHYSGIIEINRKMFRTYTIPMRMFILMHERMHYTLDSTIEEKADINALNICLALGFPKIEMIYAATKVFRDTEQNRNRVALMVQYIENYN